MILNPGSPSARFELWLSPLTLFLDICLDDCFVAQGCYVVCFEKIDTLTFTIKVGQGPCHLTSNRQKKI